MSMRYSAKIIENGKARYAGCSCVTHRKGATVCLGSAMWEGDTYVCGTTTYRHMPERSTDFASAWELVGSDLVQYITAKPE